MRRIAKSLILAAAAFFVASDLFAWLATPYGVAATEIPIQWAYEWPTLPFVFGVGIGHLFWPSRTVWEQWARLGFLWVIVLCLFMLDVFALSGVPPTLSIIVGGIVGHLLWPMPSASRGRL